jgi:tetratricopeptide (TPR) repeat protein
VRCDNGKGRPFGGRPAFWVEDCRIKNKENEMITILLEKPLPTWFILIIAGAAILEGFYIKFLKERAKNSEKNLKEGAKNSEKNLKEQINNLKEQNEELERIANTCKTATYIQKEGFDALNKETENLRRQLKDVNIDPMRRYIDNAIANVNNVNNEIKSNLKIITDKIEAIIQENSNDNFELHLSLANAYIANKDWEKAAKQFENVTKIENDSWELYFSQGVAFANTRKGIESNQKALLAYSSATVFLQNEVENNFKARLYIYKGAILKRLNRLEEAETDIKLGLTYATNEYEFNDGLYNLSCVYAMRGEEDKYFESAMKLKDRNTSDYARLINRLGEYAPIFKRKLIEKDKI